MKRISITIFLVVVVLAAYFVGGCGKIERPPGYSRSDNFLIIDGAPFFPIGIYSVNPPSAFKELKEAGFNCLHTYELSQSYLSEYVHRAEALKLKVLIFPGGRIGMPQFDIKEVEDSVKKLKDSSAILAWYLSDEPDLGGTRPRDIKKEMKVIHELDSSHPTAQVVANPKKFRKYAEAADILMVDPYPIPRSPLITVARVIDMARKAVKEEKPVWAILQAFGYQSEKNRGWGWEREPTYEEMKAMTYLAIIHEAKGIFYYTYHGSQYFIKDSPEHWRDLKEIVRELNNIYPILVGPKARINMETVELEAGQSQSRLSIHWIAKKIDEGHNSLEKGLYLLAVNTIKNDVDVTFNVGSSTFDLSTISVLFEERELKTKGNSFEDHFAPYEVHIYRLGKEAR